MSDVDQQPKKIKTAKNRAGRKRNSNSPLASSRLYFNNDTKIAIINFQQAQTLKEKELIYAKSIAPVFEKLVENLINVHKFSTFDDGCESLKNDTVVFLYETLRKYDPNRGTNAFSYFNVVAKNFLIIRTKQKLLHLKRNISFDDPEMTSGDEKMFDENCMVYSNNDEYLDFQKPSRLIQMLTQIRSDLDVENEILCIDAIIQLFSNIEEIDLLNRNAAIKYLQEMSGLPGKQLTVALNAIKKMYNQYHSDDITNNFLLYL